MRVADRTDVIASLVTGNSPTFGLDHMEGYSIAFVATGTPVGVLKLQASNNPTLNNVGSSGNENPNAAWVDIPGATFSVGAGTLSTIFNVSAAYYRGVRYVYTATSGAGAATVFLHAKGPQS